MENFLGRATIMLQIKKLTYYRRNFIMAINMAAIQGRIAFEPDYLEPKENKRAVISLMVSVQRNYKPEGEKYYPEDLIRVKAFGPKAEFIHKNFQQGSFIGLTGDLREDKYEKDGKTIRNNYFNVSECSFPQGGRNENEGSSESSSTSSSNSSNPFDKKKETSSSNPFNKKPAGSSNPFKK